MLFLALILPLIPLYLLSIMFSFVIFLIGIPLIIMTVFTTVSIGFGYAIWSSKVIPWLYILKDLLMKWSETGDLKSYVIPRVPSLLEHEPQKEITPSAEQGYMSYIRDRI
jgi:hypothetical protein